MDAKRIEYADAPEGFWQIIAGLEAEGMKFLGSISRKASLTDQAQVDVWDELVRRRNGMITQVHYGEIVFCFERPNMFDGPRTKRAYAKTVAA